MGYLDSAKEALLLLQGDEETKPEHITLLIQIAQAEMLQRIAAALEELAKCVDPEVSFLWTRQFRDKDGN